MPYRYIGCTDDQVTFGGNDDPRGLLVVGQVYELAIKVEHNWYARYYLTAYPGKAFNSECFEHVMDPIVVPWTFRLGYDNGEPVSYEIKEGRQHIAGIPGISDQDEALAKFIVKAVNAHDELVAALKAFLSECWDVPSYATIDRAETLLRRIEEE